MGRQSAKQNLRRIVGTSLVRSGGLSTEELAEQNPHAAIMREAQLQLVSSVEVRAEALSSPKSATPARTHTRPQPKSQPPVVEVPKVG